MAESRYSQYVIRKPAIIGQGGHLEIPDKIDLEVTHSQSEIGGPPLGARRSARSCC